MRTKLNKREIATIIKLQERIEKMARSLEDDNDIVLHYGNGTASDQLYCAAASLECIIQEHI